ncbi:hypothetical protein BT67DRAFT_102221 [Trichocladium antarcticum]|uniref:Uncharacterized protein n=1 Tax=Trichocladium antarcticum TaxID=1450529 RepID=A0AAN6ZH26_9PEZI|nr:hypothetical protein BT67DRAFT_102221 [Trichocladium antarcticum]
MRTHPCSSRPPPATNSASSFSPSRIPSIPFSPLFPPSITLDGTERNEACSLDGKAIIGREPPIFQRLGSSQDKGTPLSDFDRPFQDRTAGAYSKPPPVRPLPPRLVPAAPPRLTRQPGHVLTPTPLGRRPFHPALISC